MAEWTFIFLEAHAAMPTGTADAADGISSGTYIWGSIVDGARGAGLDASLDVPLGSSRKGVENRSAAFSPVLLILSDPAADKG